MGKISKVSGMILCLIAFYILLGVSVVPPVYAANSVSNGNNKAYATVDTDAGTAGYFTSNVVIRKKSDRNDQKVWFSVRGTGSMTVTLQFVCPGDSGWTDHSSYTAPARKVIDGGASGVSWRAVVKDADYTSGALTFGFDW